jgi:hypothetical protein
MEKYFIVEVLDYDCDNEGVLTVTFTLEGDPEGTYRFIERDDYYYFAEEMAKEDDSYMLKEWEEGDFEGEGYYYEQFDFREWKEYEHSEDLVKEFIYENYLKIGDLPEPENE